MLDLRPVKKRFNIIFNIHDKQLALSVDLPMDSGDISPIQVMNTLLQAGSMEFDGDKAEFISQTGWMKVRIESVAVPVILETKPEGEMIPIGDIVAMDISGAEKNGNGKPARARKNGTGTRKRTR